MQRYYAGIGSRDFTESKRPIVIWITKTLEKHGYILRSGAAPGHDTEFEDAVENPANKEIYLPWKGFNNSTSELYHITTDALWMAGLRHPNWKQLKPPVQRLMARNCYQVMGFDLKTPVDVVICGTPSGFISGGTSQAARVAEFYDIPVYNINNEIDMALLSMKLEILEAKGPSILSKGFWAKPNKRK